MTLMNNSLLIVMVVALGVTFVSMVLHELMHGLTAYWLGDDTAKVNGRLSLNPIKHIDPYLTIILPGLIILSNFFLGTNMPIFGGAKPVPFNPNKVKGGEWGAALVAIAGPLTNLVLAFICFCGIGTFAGARSGTTGANIDLWRDGQSGLFCL